MRPAPIHGLDSQRKIFVINLARAGCRVERAPESDSIAIAEVGVSINELSTKLLKRDDSE